ncbi:methyltransferase domain protein [Marvinbryantia formatexigens DSM 14469]|uniref:Methyltransferase domain protein n=2 Tax=Marvinbryantia TaxID=248744 RepID=C6LMK3_9FIRM|nr:methyltransferase domain protein [Marvinbryantia formatexigens DSM 14469]
MTIIALSSLMMPFFHFTFREMGININLRECTGSVFPENTGEKKMKNDQRGKDMWNTIYAESQPVDLREKTLSVEPLFDTCLMMFAGKTNQVLDFGCGTGDILFQYAQYKRHPKGAGIDSAKTGVSFARETARMSGYSNLHFFEGDESFLDVFEAGRFDGIILSNVLDVMPESIGYQTAVKLNRVLKEGGYWFIKLNPFYTTQELKDMEYEEMGPHMYGEGGILRLKQEPTPYWMEIFQKIGSLERYVEFPYEWQPGMNRLFLIRKTSAS